jgi:hypothetical protein
MEDYVIKRTGDGEFVISAHTERAQNRTPGGIIEGHVLAFKSRSELAKYVTANETLGFTLAEKRRKDCLLREMSEAEAPRRCFETYPFRYSPGRDQPGQLINMVVLDVAGPGPPKYAWATMLC